MKHMYNLITLLVVILAGAAVFMGVRHIMKNRKAKMAMTDVKIQNRYNRSY